MSCCSLTGKPSFDTSRRTDGVVEMDPIGDRAALRVEIAHLHQGCGGIEIEQLDTITGEQEASRIAGARRITKRDLGRAESPSPCRAAFRPGRHAARVTALRRDRHQQATCQHAALEYQKDTSTGWRDHSTD
ncbi:MAG: hypothetical protein ABW178_06175 [Pseudoxanthomonas sp.]